MNINNNHRQKERGFTLLEALIGFLILSIGMLGIVSLQAISLKTAKTSVYGSVAVMKIDELFESMRANPSAAALTAYKDAGDGIDHGCTGAKNCSGIELAEDDVFWWTQSLKAGLPAGAGAEISVTPAAAALSKMSTVTIKVRWSDREKSDLGSVEKFYIVTTNICTDNPC